MAFFQQQLSSEGHTGGVQDRHCPEDRLSQLSRGSFQLLTIVTTGLLADSPVNAGLNLAVEPHSFHVLMMDLTVRHDMFTAEDLVLIELCDGLLGLHGAGGLMKFSDVL